MSRLLNAKARAVSDLFDPRVVVASDPGSSPGQSAGTGGKQSNERSRLMDCFVGLALRGSLATIRARVTNAP